MSAPLSDRTYDSAHKLGRLSEIMDRYSNCTAVSLKLQKDDPKIEVNSCPITERNQGRPSTQIKRKSNIPLIKPRHNRASTLTQRSYSMESSAVEQREVVLSNGQNLIKQVLRPFPESKGVNIKQIFKKKSQVLVVGVQQMQNNALPHLSSIKSQQGQNKAEGNPPKDVKMSTINSAIQKCEQMIRLTKKRSQPMRPLLNQPNFDSVYIPKLNLQCQNVASSLRYNKQNIENGQNIQSCWTMDANPQNFLSSPLRLDISFSRDIQERVKGSARSERAELQSSLDF